MILSTLRPQFAAFVLALAAVTLSPAATYAQQLNYERDERFRGLVRPVRQVQLGAPVDGIIGEVLVGEHDRVEAGEILIRMDDAVQQEAVAVAKLRAEDETEIRRQQLLLAESEIQLERMEDLAERDAAQDWEVRRARLQRDATQAALEHAQHQQAVARHTYEVEQERLRRLHIKAPFDGLVVRIEGDSGSSLRLGDRILHLIAMDTLEAQLYLPVELYGQLETGREYELLAQQPVNRSLVGTLKSVEPVIDSASNTFRAVFSIDNQDLELPVGFTVRLVWPQEPLAEGER